MNKLLQTGSFVRLRHNTVDRVFSLLERGRVHDRTSLLFILFYYRNSRKLCPGKAAFFLREQKCEYYFCKKAFPTPLQTQVSYMLLSLQ